MAKVLQVVVAEKVTGFPGHATIFACCWMKACRDPRLFEDIRYVTNTAAALRSSTSAMLRELFPKAKIFSMYGLTECKRCTYLPPKDIDREPTSVGVAIPNTELWIVDEHDRRLGPDVVAGQLVIRGATVMERLLGEAGRRRRSACSPGPDTGRTGPPHGGSANASSVKAACVRRAQWTTSSSRAHGKVAPKEVEAALRVDSRREEEAAVIGVHGRSLGSAP